MAAPIADKIILPLDTGNTGKKVRTQTRVVGADTVHEHYFVAVSARSRVGVYYAHSALLTIPTSAHNGTTTGYIWLINPVGSAVKMALRRYQVHMQFLVTSAVDVSVPREVLALCTFTGTASGATITPAKRDSTDAAAVGSMRTASTGLSVTLGALITAALPPIVATASSATIQANMPSVITAPFVPTEDEMPILRAGEGVVLYSADASTTANRRMIADFVWEEFE